MKRIIAILLTAVMLFGMIPLASAEAGMNNFQKTQTYSAGQFTDVKTADWFAAGVQSAYELGLMKGSSDSAFKPSGNLTVAEALAIACRLHSIYADNGQTFTQGNPWYQVYVDYAVANKIMTAGQLAPTAQITREQFAYLMCGAIPAADLGTINTIAAIPDVAEKSTYGGFVYRLYRAGVLTGSDKYGTFKPTTAIQRSEVATIVTRMADKAQRKTVTLEKKPVAVTEIQLAGKTKITVGENAKWTAKVLPEGVQTKLTWTAGNPGVATVDQNGNIKGLKAGQCNITVTAANGVKKTVLLTVTDIPVTEIRFGGVTKIGVGNSTTWTATILPSDATNKKLTWSAGNPSVATVDQNGKITGHKVGQCNITATAPNGVKKTVMVTVLAPTSLSSVQGKVTGQLIIPHVGVSDNTYVEIKITNECGQPITIRHNPPKFTANGYSLHVADNLLEIPLETGYYTKYTAYTVPPRLLPYQKKRIYLDSYSTATLYVTIGITTFLLTFDAQGNSTLS